MRNGCTRRGLPASAVAKRVLPFCKATTGQGLELQQDDGQRIPVRITAVENETVTLDANHPLAGEALTFEIELVEIV